MHCEWCPICPNDKDDECGYFGQYGKEYKDGQYGCTMPRNKIEKLDDEHSKYLGDMGLDIGIEIDFEHHEWSMGETIDLIKWTIINRISDTGNYFINRIVITLALVLKMI